MKKIFTLLMTALFMATGSALATVVTTISSDADWKSFVKSVKDGDDYSSVTVTLTGDITLPENASNFANDYMPGGDSSHPFKGTFDGDGHTITYKKTGLSEDYQALFRYVESATIKNLKTSGKLESSGSLVASIIGNAKGTTTLENCSSDMELISTNSTDCRIGGLVARCADTGASLTVKNCMFNGSISAGQSERANGIVGWSSGTTVNLSSCFVNPTSVTNGGERFSNVKSYSEKLWYTGTSFTSNTGGTEATTAKLLSGEVAYDLQNTQAEQYWGQANLNRSNVDAYPSLTSDATKKVVKVKISGMSTTPCINPGGAVPNPVRFSVTGFKKSSTDSYTLETMPAETEFNYGSDQLETTKKMYCITLPAEATTLVLPFESTIPEGITAYDITYTSGNTVTATKVDKIEANKPVLINGTEGQQYKFSTSTDATYSSATATNGALTGVFVQQGSSDSYNPFVFVPKDSYVLQNGTSGLGFYKVNEANKIKITSFRAYLTPATNAPSLLSIFFDDNSGATGISEMQNANEEEGVVYDLSGRIVPNPQKGLYIKNGKKFFVK